MGSCELIRKYKSRNGKILTKKELESQVQSDRDMDIAEDGSLYSGSWGSKSSGIRYKNKIFNSYDEGYNELLNNDKFSSLEAVEVHEKLGTPTQNKNIEKQNDLIRKLVNDIYVIKSKWVEKTKSRKSKTMSCPHCKTRFEITRINSIGCPMCGKNLMSDTDNKKLEKAKEKHSNAVIKRDQMILKRTGKVEKYWLVGGNCPS